jgi:uncharacterized protein
MIDVNTRLGNWPWRPLEGLDGLLRYMDAEGVEKAVVSSLSAVHYFNPRHGNHELAECIAPHRNRLIPLAVLKPGFAGVEDDFRRCIEAYGMRGIMLHPGYHRYRLYDNRLERLMALAAECGLPVCVQTGLEDPRRQYDREIIGAVPPEDTGNFARRYPENTIIVLGLKWGQPELLGDPFPNNLYFDISNYESLGEIEHAVARFGAERMLFGTNYPIFTPLANVEKLRCADIRHAERQAIAQENAAAIFGTA